MNALALAGALLAAALGAWALTRPAAAPVAATPSADSAPAEVVGADGAVVPVRAYRRIASMSPAVDDALAELGAAGRLCAITAAGRRGTRARLLRGVEGTMPTFPSVEDVLALRPDLVVVTAFGDPGRSARLRAAGVPVLVIPPERGARDAAAAVRLAADAIGEHAAGAALAERFLARLARVAPPDAPRRRALYVGSFDGKLFGGAAGTSYHDVLEAAGLIDVAAQAGWKDFPEYRLEDLIALAPDIIVAGAGVGAPLLERVGASRIPAVAARRIVEVDHGLLGTPGIGMLEAAEAVAAAVARLPAEARP